MPATLAEIFRQTVAHDRPDTILTKREGRYEPISARELRRRVGRLRGALSGVGINKGDRCAILAENRWEWAVADFAMMTSGIVSVPLYPTLTGDKIQYMLEHSESRIVFVSTGAQVDKIVKVWDQLPGLEGVVVFDRLSADDSRVVAFESLIGDEALSAADEKELEQGMASVRSEDPASVIYTSGTTGTPKGVLLSHGNIATNVRDCGFDITRADVCLSFLPLSHVAERTADYVFFSYGAAVAYAESMDTVPKNMQEVRPTMAVAVPRFFEKVHGRVMTAMAEAPPLRRKLFDWAVKVGGKTVPYRTTGNSIPPLLAIQYALADAIVLKKFRGRLGGRFKRFVSGAAPLGKRLAEFFWSVGIPIYEAYGLTETSPLITINKARETKIGSVGRLIENVEVRIADDGEILVRGPNVMQGYLKMPEETATAIDAEGWFHTGDIGEFDADRFLSITDRKKDLLKTSGGKYIAPAAVEGELKSSPFISMAVVFAEGRNFPSALVVPNFDRLTAWAQQQDIPTRGHTELLANEHVIALLESEAEKACTDLPRYEKPKKFIWLDRELSLENGEITPTMKVRRKAVEMRFERQIDALYSG